MTELLEPNELVEGGAIFDIDAFIAVHHRRLLGLAMLRTGNRDDADDLAQEALVRLVNNWETVQQMDNPWGWLATVTVNLSISRWRRHARFLRAVGRLETVSINETEPQGLIELIEVIKQLPERQRLAVLLRHYAQLSTRETATAMSCAEGTVKALVHQALGRLRTELEEEIDHED